MRTYCCRAVLRRCFAPVHQVSHVLGSVFSSDGPVEPSRWSLLRQRASSALQAAAEQAASSCVACLCALGMTELQPVLCGHAAGRQLVEESKPEQRTGMQGCVTCVAISHSRTPAQQTNPQGTASHVGGAGSEYTAWCKGPTIREDVCAEGALVAHQHLWSHPSHTARSALIQDPRSPGKSMRPDSMLKGKC